MANTKSTLFSDYYTEAALKQFVLYTFKLMRPSQADAPVLNHYLRTILQRLLLEDDCPAVESVELHPEADTIDVLAFFILADGSRHAVLCELKTDSGKLETHQPQLYADHAEELQAEGWTTHAVLLTPLDQSSADRRFRNDVLRVCAMDSLLPEWLCVECEDGERRNIPSEDPLFNTFWLEEW